MKPHPNNFCGGNFPGWLEVMLTKHCNGKCTWCVEKRGFHPEGNASKDTLVRQAVDSGAKNVILLGGEPTLSWQMPDVIKGLRQNGLSVYVTTNGSKLDPAFVRESYLTICSGINISIHHHSLSANGDITGIYLLRSNLKDTISELRLHNVKVRLNCNLIAGQIDSSEEIHKYIEWAKLMGATGVRFAELKFDDQHFVDLTKIFGDRYGLNTNPFVEGCNHDAVINDMPVNFRQMCGFQTSLRPRPEDPEFAQDKKVLYYDGKIYDGWQIMTGEDMHINEIKNILRKVSSGKLDVEEAAKMIKDRQAVAEGKARQEGWEYYEEHKETGGHCRY